MSDIINAKRAGSMYLIGNLFNKGISFLTVPIFTRLLNTSEYGIVTTYNSWASMLSIFLSLALYMGIRAAFIDYKDKENEFLSTIIVFNLVYGMIFSIVVLALIIALHINVNSALVMLCLMQGVAAGIIEDLSTYLMMRYKYKIRTIFMVFPNLISVVVSIFVIKGGLLASASLGKIVPTAIVTILFGFSALIISFRYSKPKVKTEYLVYSLKISLPLILHGIALSVLSQSDRIMLTSMRNSAETGIYGLVYNFSMIATVFTTAFEGIWIPWFTRKMGASEYKDINLWAKKYVAVMTLLMSGIILVGPEIIKLLAAKEYWEGITIVPPLVLANYLIFLYTLYVNIEHYYKKTVFISFNTIIAATTNILLNIIIIPKYGYVGAAYTTLFSYCVSLIAHRLYSKHINPEVIPVSVFLPNMIMLALSIGVFYLFIDVLILRWLVAILFTLYLSFRERTTLRSVLLKKNG